mmetsp:Transcript_15813/g.27798  ORF Transcript_15813/g.27798 Transcript_15813/m.27798 type:complete len:274 (-) Transcript_15813:2008-2829(-)
MLHFQLHLQQSNFVLEIIQTATLRGFVPLGAVFVRLGTVFTTLAAHISILFASVLTTLAQRFFVLFTIIIFGLLRLLFGCAALDLSALHTLDVLHQLLHLVTHFRGSHGRLHHTVHGTRDCDDIALDSRADHLQQQLLNVLILRSNLDRILHTPHTRGQLLLRVNQLQYSLQSPQAQMHRTLDRHDKRLVSRGRRGIAYSAQIGQLHRQCGDLLGPVTNQLHWHDGLLQSAGIHVGEIVGTVFIALEDTLGSRGRREHLEDFLDVVSRLHGFV